MKTCCAVQNLLSGVMSSSSEDNGYPEDMGQDKHDDSTEDSDTERSDVESDGDEFGHRDDSEHNNAVEKSGPSIRLPHVTGKSRNKKNMKELTSLQTMMLRMAGQEIPEEGREVEEFSEEDDDHDSDDSEAEKQSQKQHKEDSHSDGSSACCLLTAADPSTVRSSFSDISTSHASTTTSRTTTSPPLWPPGPPTGLPPGPPPGPPPFLGPSEMPEIQGLLPRLLPPVLYQADLLALPQAHLQVCRMDPLLEDPHQGYLLLHIQVSLLVLV